MKIESNGDAPNWYVVHTHARQEERAESNLRAWRVETFFPKVREQCFSQYTGVRYMTKPLFPRYIFARFNVNDLLHKIQFTRGVHSLIQFNHGPVPVSDEIITMIKSRSGSDGYVKIEEPFNAGDQVFIHDGPLKNFSGVFDSELKDADRVRILLQTVSYQAHVIVEKKLVKKVNQMAYGGSFLY